MTLTHPLTSTATLTLTRSLTLHLDPRATQPQRSERGADLLTSVVAVLTKMI